jgi:polysaccharide export outer membrane protein
MYKKYFILIFILSFILSVVSFEDLFSQEKKEYILNPGDLIEIDVYGEPDLHTSTRISEDGSINFPLLGNLKVKGLSVQELEKLITELLAQDYLVNPQVSVFVREYPKVFVSGLVRQPGAFDLKEPLTLLSAISLAGGFLPEADTTQVKLIRNVDGKIYVERINIDKIMDNTIPDILLKPNDKIEVEEAGKISIIGQVQHPGSYPFRKGMTLMEAIGMAGGFSDIANIDGTSVIRQQEGKKRSIIRIRISDITKRGDKSKDILLQPGDTIVVPESLF